MEKSCYPCIVAQVISIGFDCAGWLGKKNAFSALIFSENKFIWKAPQIFKVPDEPGYFSLDFIYDKLNIQINSGDTVVIAIDAPLGVPKQFLPFFQGDYRLRKPTSGIQNEVAYRYTDQHIFNLSGNRPLSILDKMGINITLALTHVAEWRKKGFHIQQPNKTGKSHRQIIEVYPATIRNCTSKAKRQIKNLLTLLKDQLILDSYEYYQNINGVKKTDQLDSSLCSILGMSYLCSHKSLPALEKNVPDQYFSDQAYSKEGWIYYLPFETLNPIL